MIPWANFECVDDRASVKEECHPPVSSDQCCSVASTCIPSKNDHLSLSIRTTSSMPNSRIICLYMGSHCAMSHPYSTRVEQPGSWQAGSGLVTVCESVCIYHTFWQYKPFGISLSSWEPYRQMPRHLQYRGAFSL